MSIELINVSKKYSNKYVVKDLSLKVEDGEITILIGPSGCGKTTTLKLINRLIERTTGDILFDGKSIDNIDKIQLRRSIGYVIQEIGLFPHYTVYENIAVVPKLLNWNKEKINERVEELLELVNLDYESVINKYPLELSGGQRQRVGVARALAANPKILLMDEPFGAIDPINREILQDVFLNIQNKLKKTIVFVTHDIREAIKLGDKIAILNNGALVQYDKTINIIKKPKNDFVKNLLGSNAELNFLEFVKAYKMIDNNFKTIRNINEIDDLNKDCYVLFNDKYEGFLTKNDLRNKKKKLRCEFIDYNSNVLEGLNIMFKNNIHCLPVLKDGKIIGVLNYDSIFSEE
ncbi:MULTISPECIES: ABC transporter ATP-binding protein [unclassified Marinitoga]|uniref:ABC transporter ATP-binding protein n=1 Tax=unclassified Marinitoga TaxID=2640159 RepID=UPI000640C167|nr:MULTISPECIES: ABC transporter ATP-binding protein [unclassified Marinitoga]KLO25105.1 glycine/betaine ABC transporter ATPase [Marinitoga sp. 1155]NUU98603.1 glycine/betaine ABC transporter ATPase [Marinitoga sp. 1154]